jgi:hypothetical protein
MKAWSGYFIFLIEKGLISLHVITTIGTANNNHDSQSRRLSPINAENNPINDTIARIVGVLKVFCIVI